jgi:hypothetical protein
LRGHQRDKAGWSSFLKQGQSAFNVAAARLRHIAVTAWSTKGYLNIGVLKNE